MAPVKGQNSSLPRPFPILTPQAYLPGSAGGAGLYPGFPSAGGTGFPPLAGNPFLSAGLEPPIMNFSGGPGMYPGSSIPSIYPPPMPQPNPSLASVGPAPGVYESGYGSSSRGRPVRMCRRRRRRRHRSQRCRPVIRIVESSSCSSISSCSSRSSCSRRCHRSHSCRQDNAPQQQQQPIILLPVPMQQSAPTQNPVQTQPQQIILPPIQVQQPGQLQQPQQLALPSMPMQQLNASNILSNGSSNPIILSGGQSSSSLPQIANLGALQQVQTLPTQYVQLAQPMTTSASPLQYVSSQPRSTVAPQRVLVNSTNKKQSTKSKTVGRSASVRDVPQNDLKFGRRPFDWYENKKQNNNIINENIQLGQRGSANAI